MTRKEFEESIPAVLAFAQRTMEKGCDPNWKPEADMNGLIHLPDNGETYIKEEWGKLMDHFNMMQSAMILKVMMKAANVPEGTFGYAIEALKRGFEIKRRSWDGNTFLWLKPAAKIKSAWCKDPILKNLADSNNGELNVTGTICMLMSDRLVMTGWTPSQRDMLADDWIVRDLPDKE